MLEKKYNHKVIRFLVTRPLPPIKDLSPPILYTYRAASKHTDTAASRFLIVSGTMNYEPIRLLVGSY